MVERKRCRRCLALVAVNLDALLDHQNNFEMKAAPRYRFDAFADVRMGKSLPEMSYVDWLVKDNPNG